MSSKMIDVEMICARINSLKTSDSAKTLKDSFSTKATAKFYSADIVERSAVAIAKQAKALYDLSLSIDSELEREQDLAVRRALCEESKRVLCIAQRVQNEYESASDVSSKLAAAREASEKASKRIAALEAKQAKIEARSKARAARKQAKIDAKQAKIDAKKAKQASEATASK